ncbi:MAG: YbaN family protein, partial [Proteobacteria bacterium]|nr:YbaN family protein [Pseudomonadota bacterium]
MDGTRRIDRPVGGETGAGAAGEAEPRVCAPVRYGLMALGWVNIGLGVLGMFLPVMPATVFLLIALWAFSRSSRRFHRWLYTHPTQGRTLRDWHSHRVIPLRVKILAVSMMTVSLS